MAAAEAFPDPFQDITLHNVDELSPSDYRALLGHLTELGISYTGQYGDDEARSSLARPNTPPTLLKFTDFRLYGRHAGYLKTYSRAWSTVVDLSTAVTVDSFAAYQQPPERNIRRWPLFTALLPAGEDRKKPEYQLDLASLCETMPEWLEEGRIPRRAPARGLSPGVLGYLAGLANFYGHQDPPFPELPHQE